MLTKQDIQLMQEVFVTKEDLASLVDVVATKEEMRDLQTAVDGLAKLVKDFREEHIVIHHRLEILEDWAKKVSAKTGIPLPY